jgi:hypothetical protein
MLCDLISFHDAKSYETFDLAKFNTNESLDNSSFEMGGIIQKLGDIPKQEHGPQMAVLRTFRHALENVCKVLLENIPGCRSTRLFDKQSPPTFLYI